MEFSCCLLPPYDPMALVEMTRAAAGAGYDRVWIPDQSLRCDPFATLVQLANEVDVPLGLAVTNPFARHPVQVARSLATVWHLTGRTDWRFALGASNPHHVLKPLGLSMRNSSRQIGAAVAVIKKLLAGETVSYRDPRSDFVLDDVRIELEPVPDAKILVGTRGPQTMAEAGRHADGILVEGLFTAEGIQWARDVISEGAGERNLDSFEYTAWQVAEVLDGGAEVPAHAAKFARVLMSTTHPKVLARLGFDDELIMRAHDEAAAEPMPAWAVQSLIAVGTADQLLDRVTAAAQAGAGGWACSFTGNPAETVHSLKRFAAEVIDVYRTTEMKAAQAE